ncbi:MAG TPA: GAF domain-containing protein, partial [Anaerolineales bacterium]|nr:GAF domain-containing protein [Anaerolineales bacterium]
REELGSLGVMDIGEQITSLKSWQKQVNLVRDTGGLIFETAHRQKDGQTYPVEISARMLEYGKRMVMVTVARDITERKQAEIALRESEERFRKVFHSSPIAICITTLREGKLLDANYAYWDLSGYDPQTSIGHDHIELSMWESLEARHEFIRTIRQQRSIYNPDYQFEDIHGNQKSVLAFYELIQLGGQDCILSMFYDMSIQKSTMQALQQSEMRIRALLNAFPDMILELSADGVIISLIPPKGMGPVMTTEQVVGRQIHEIFSESIVAQTFFALERTLESNLMSAFEFEVDKGGVIHFMEARLVTSAPNTALMMIRDITERKQIEQEREGLIKQLEIKHEESETLRESLASIVGTFEFSEIIQRILSQIRRVIPYDTASVWRLEGDQQEIIAGVDMPPNIAIPGTTLVVDKSNSAFPLLNGTLPYLLSNNVQEELQDFQQPPHNYVQSLLAIPLKTRGKIVGLIDLDGRQKGQFDEHHAELAVIFANQLAIALENARLFSGLQNELEERRRLIAELEQRNAESETLRQSVAIVAATLDKSEAIARILEQLEKVVHFDSASVQLIIGDMLEMVSARGFDLSPDEAENRFELNESEPAYPVLREITPYVLYDDIQLSVPAFGEYPHNRIHAWLAVPLKVKGRMIGIIALDGERVGQFSEKDAQLALTYANQVAIALENARLFSELQSELAERKQAETNLRQREAILEIVADAANRFLKTTDWRMEIDLMLERLGKTINASHAYLFENHQLENGAPGTSIRYQWTAPSAVSDLENPDYLNMPLTEDNYFNDWYENMSNGSPYVGDVEHLPQAGMELLLGRGMKALLDVPIYADGVWWGTIGFDDVENLRGWSNAEVDALMVAANILGAAIQRQRADALLQEELAHRKKLIAELESKNAELERFTYTVSHDLKSPLFTIRGFLGYLEQDALSGNEERLRRDIERITGATDRMQQLLNDLLELSRIGRLMNEPQEVDFEELVYGVLELLHGQIQERGVKVHVHSGMPDIHGDRQRLMEVVQNLMDNAAKFMGEQTDPQIEIGAAGEEDGMPVFFVRDNGIGISAEHYERVFGLFNKLDPRSEGTGIGLSLVKRIVEFHGGRIWLRSEAGRGSIFFFTLPRSRAAPAQPPPDSVI